MIADDWKEMATQCVVQVRMYEGRLADLPEHGYRDHARSHALSWERYAVQAAMYTLMWALGSEAGETAPRWAWCTCGDGIDLADPFESCQRSGGVWTCERCLP